MPDFLPAGTYADAGKRFLDDYLEYLALTSAEKHEENRPGHWRRSEDRSTRRWELLHAFSAEPLRDRNLHRVNWTMAAAERPRLELSVFLYRQKLILSAQPHEDTVGYVQSRGWYCQRKSTDFKAFHRYGASDPDAFSTEVLELTVGGMLGLHGVSHWGFEVSPETDAIEVLERRMISSVLRHKIHQLSLSFDCVLHTSLVTFGPDAILELRDKRDRHSYSSNFTHRGDDDYPGMNLLAEPSIQDLVKQYDLDAHQFESFLQTYLFPKVPAELRRQTLAEYVMEAQVHKLKDEVLDLLDDYLNPERRRLRRMNEIESDPNGLEAFIARRPGDWAKRLASALRASEEGIYEWVEAVHPKIAANAVYDYWYVRKHLEGYVNQKRPPKKRVASMSNRMIKMWDGAMRPAPLSGFQRALDRAASDVGSGSYDQLLQWSAKFCPPLHAHATERVVELRALAEQRSRKPRAK